MSNSESRMPRFTDRARKVMQLANQEALKFNHEYVGTEHILLGLVKEGSGVAASVFKNLDVDLRKIGLEVERLVQHGPEMVTMGKLPQTPRAKKVIEYAIEEARLLNHSYVGTEHLLLGILRERETVAAKILVNLGLDLAEVRQRVLAWLGAQSPTDPPPPPPPSNAEAEQPAEPARPPAGRLRFALRTKDFTMFPILQEQLENGQWIDVPWIREYKNPNDE